ncbi:type II toxin-antitoxin system PrlF family antitoxin [Candidatus Dependentiae bacterium]|nr:type II toxin-antitoxin system PrlF family antitoxin [Candidatus Dependentiae bacterium]
MRKKIDSSTLTSKFQATIPKRVREKLGLVAGDSLIFDINKQGEVKIRKFTSGDNAYLRAVQSTLDEWNSPEDDNAYAHLQDL